MLPEGEPHAYYSDETADYLEKLLGNRAKIREGKPITLIDNNSEPEPDIAIRPPAKVLVDRSTTRREKVHNCKYQQSN